ncbi:MAG: adenosylmethionine decarboxylase [Gammaproteobacteria bacterium]|nr:adenosylmethionine decarboxylase [Gammaproteobacteria bacterium]
MDKEPKISLYGFNNLTKTLSFNFYDICYAKNKRQRDAYLDYIDETYNSQRLTEVLAQVAKIIGANILNVATQDYEPSGSSVTMLISEEDAHDVEDPSSPSVVAHLDKSHLTAHTYPESHPDGGISTFRADLDISTCGRISPLKALNFLIDSFDEDIVIMDYRIRGFTRDVEGKKFYKDHSISSIQDYLSERTLAQYQLIDVNVYPENFFHTKMMLKEFDFESYLFGQGSADMSAAEIEVVEKHLKKEMTEIFYGMNMPD